MNKYILPFLAAFAFMMTACGDDTSTDETTTAEETVVPVLDNETPTIEMETTEVLPTEALGVTTSMIVDRIEHDFGNIPDTAPVETVFTISNTGSEPLLISGAQGSCGCTVPEYPKEPIPAGESREMKVSFDPSGKEGAQAKTVTLTANTDPLTTVVNIKSTVEKTAQ